MAEKSPHHDSPTASLGERGYPTQVKSTVNPGLPPARPNPLARKPVSPGAFSSPSNPKHDQR